MFGLPERSFKNHKQLDNFFDELLAACPNFRTAYPHDCALLKAYGTFLFLFFFLLFFFRTSSFSFFSLSLFLFLFSFIFLTKYSQPRPSLLANARERRSKRTRNGRTRAIRMPLQWPSFNHDLPQLRQQGWSRQALVILHHLSIFVYHKNFPLSLSDQPPGA